MVADWFVVIVATVALKVAEVPPAGTVTEPATGSAVLLLDSPTVLPPLGAACLKVTVQVVLPPELTLVGLQAREETRVGATRFTVVL